MPWLWRPFYLREYWPDSSEPASKIRVQKKKKKSRTRTAVGKGESGLRGGRREFQEGSVINPVRSSPNKGLPPTPRCCLNQQKETRFGSEAKESFLLWSEDVEADAQALEHMPWDKRGSLEMNLHFNLYQKARAFYILKVPKGFLL